jgi:hypothetical protein
MTRIPNLLPIDVDALKRELFAGAVSAAAYDTVCAERDALQEKVRDLEAEIGAFAEDKAWIESIKDKGEMSAREPSVDEPETSVRRPYLSVVGGA